MVRIRARDSESGGIPAAAQSPVVTNPAVCGQCRPAANVGPSPAKHRNRLTTALAAGCEPYRPGRYGSHAGLPITRGVNPRSDEVSPRSAGGQPSGDSLQTRWTFAMGQRKTQRKLAPGAASGQPLRSALCRTQPSAGRSRVIRGSRSTSCGQAGSQLWSLAAEAGATCATPVLT